MSDPCTRSTGAAGGPCGATPTRRFIAGARCAEHTPAALLGKPEPTGQYCPPKICWCGQCPWWTPVSHYPIDSWVTDARAIASGKRRASPEMYARAKAEVAAQKARSQPRRSA